MTHRSPARNDRSQPGSVAREPKFCRCRICHEHFYGKTIAEAHRACLAHRESRHPEWADAVCYCPD